MPYDPNDLKKHSHWGQETILRGFPMVLGSWWEISENGDRRFTQNFDARLLSIVVCPGEPFSEKCLFWTKFQDTHVRFSGNKFPKWIFPNVAIRKELKWSQIQYFQDPGFLKWLEIQYFQDSRSPEWLVLRYFGVPRSSKRSVFQHF